MNILKRLLGLLSSPLLVKRHIPNHDGIQLPKKKGDVGYDLAVLEDATALPGFPVDIPCGFSMKVPNGYFALIVGRSSASRTRGLLVLPGVIDQGYTGPVYPHVYNMGLYPVTIKRGTRLAQCILLPRHVVPI